MALFGSSKKALLAQLKASEWKNSGQRDALLDQLKVDKSVRDVELVELIWHRDPAVRNAVMRVFHRQATARGAAALLEQMGRMSEAQRAPGMKLLEFLPRQILRRGAEPWTGASSGPRQALGLEVSAILARGRGGAKAPAPVLTAAVGH